MAELKTKVTEVSPADFINSAAITDQKRTDALHLLQFMQEVTGFIPAMWGASMIGYGKYHYKSERSRQEGDWPLVGFSPRKAAFSLYIIADGQDVYRELLAKLGTFTMGRGCVYVKKLADIDLGVLKSIIETTVKSLQKRYG